MKKVTRAQIEHKLVFAIHELGGTVYLPGCKWIKDYPGYIQTVITDYSAAKKARAFLIERPFMGTNRDPNRHAWRLNRLMRGGGQADIGSLCYTAREFYAALDMLEEMAKELCVKPAKNGV